jgi:uncharacterized Zn-binding protein involved in type VI secretion
MSKVALEGDVSVGETPWPSTPAIGPYSIRTKINGKSIQLKNTTMYADHSHTFGTVTITHPSMMRIVTTASNTLKIEGHYVARIGDTLGDNDIIAGPGSGNTNIGDAPVILLGEDGNAFSTETGITIAGNI